MERRSMHSYNEQQETPLRAGQLRVPTGKNCSPSTFHRSPSSQETCSPQRKENIVGLNLHPIFPITSASPSRGPQLLHAAAINGNYDTLQRAISEYFPWLEFRDRLGRTPLIYSCLGNRPECVRVLLAAGASPISVDFNGRNAFHWAARKDSYKCLKLMHKHENDSEEFFTKLSEEKRKTFGWRLKDKDGATPLHLSTCATSTKCCIYIIKKAMVDNIDSQDFKKRTPLHWASAAGNAQAIKILLKSNARVDVMDESGKPPIFYAVSSLKNNTVLCLKMLMENPLPSLNWSDNEGRCALHLAVVDQPDGAEIVEMVIRHGEFNQAKDSLGRTPLHWAAIANKPKTLMILLENIPSTLLYKDKYGATALHYAAMSNHTETVRHIVSSNDNTLEVEDINGQTPLLWAAANNACEAAQKLVNAGAETSHQDESGHSVMHGSMKTLKLLIQIGAKVNIMDKVGNTPFASACENGFLDIIYILAKNGAEVNTRNFYGRKPIHLAAYNGHTLVADYLIKMENDVNCQDIQGLTPLHIACHRGHEDFVSLLSERGAHLNIKDINGWTPLHYAAHGNHYEVVKVLLEGHANPNIHSINGKTVLDTCYDVGNTMLVNQLLKFGAVAS